MGNLVLAMFILLAAVTGCRRGEVCGLRWNDIDTEAGTIRIERQLVPRKGGQQVAPPKTRTGRRTIVVDDEVLALLDWFRDQQSALLEREPDGWLLSHDGGDTPLRAKAVTDDVSRLAKKAGIDNVTTHAFRRMTGTELSAAGVDAAAAAGRMGHTVQVMFDHGSATRCRSPRDPGTACMGAAVVDSSTVTRARSSATLLRP